MPSPMISKLLPSPMISKLLLNGGVSFPVSHKKLGLIATQWKDDPQVVSQKAVHAVQWWTGYAS